ncbi:T9SS type A sorting domain-containing protein [Vicingaceae bacterium]|nr:T9SS type A sorting domain-containing protein [Vicingaceae bacterium]
MLKGFQLLIAGMLFIVQLCAQDYLAVPTSNPVLFPQSSSSLNNEKLEVFEDNFIYLYDTLNLPFIDDFSTNRQRKRITDLTDPRLTDSVFYKIRIGNGPYQDTIGFTQDSTFRYITNSFGDTALRQPNPTFTIQYSDLSKSPVEYLIYTVFPAYNYTEQAGVPKDTVFVDATFEQDTVTFYTVASNGKDLWTDASAYINRTFPLNPPSIGVATFDGLNEVGLPYNFDIPLRVVADYLSSVPLRLGSLPDTNVFFSFFYQPKGLALDKPETEDSLIVEYYNASTERWSGAWNSIGFAADTFLQVVLKVPSQFHQDGFRFRFKNYANSTGAFDQWHVDYVYLDNGRTETQDFYNDIAYVYDAPSMLKDYYAMPWWHYKNNPSSYMADSAFTIMKNASSGLLSVFNFLNVPDTTIPGTNFYTFPAIPSSFLQIQPNSFFRFEYPTPFEFPAAKIDTAGVFESIFDIQFKPRLDFIESNDTVISRTVLQDYYAYDDGTAEAGYGVNPALRTDGLTAYMAVRYDIPFSDTLKGFQTYFLPQAVDVSKQRITLTVWSSLNPAIVLYERETVARPTYSEPNGMITFNLDTPLVVGQTFYIGFKTVGANSVNVGYDLNTNHKDKLFFSQNGITWSAPSGGINDGALMLRPVFRNRVLDVSVAENSLARNDLKVYPNPTNGKLNLEVLSTERIESIEVLDMTGKLVLAAPFQNLLHLGHLSKGIYFLKVQKENGELLTRKIILSE